MHLGFGHHPFKYSSSIIAKIMEKYHPPDSSRLTSVCLLDSAFVIRFGPVIFFYLCTGISLDKTSSVSTEIQICSSHLYKTHKYSAMLTNRTMELLPMLILG